MSEPTRDYWSLLPERYTVFPTIELAVDLSRMNFKADFISSMKAPLQTAFEAMTALEKGAIANPDENRMVGHYWLRCPELAPSAELRAAIAQMVADVKAFAAQVHAGQVRGAQGSFQNLLIIGIGGSALGPQFVADALGHPKTDKLRIAFFDNTDPDGFDKVLATFAGQLGQTLVIVISKSGGTKETRNGMLEAEAAYNAAELDFAQHAVAITGPNSELHNYAAKWLRRFPMWDWVGGRTSETSAVGLLPAALQGFDIDQLLAGARSADEVTRLPDYASNPAAQMALAWFHAANGHGSKDLVVLPYKDRLQLFSRYLQQLIMESLGKNLDVNDKVVEQGLAVYGNKGSTDQHAYVQQLRDGLNNFFATFIEVLKDRSGTSIQVEPDITAGDYLSGFLLGTRQALAEKGRESLTLTIREVSPFSVGVLIALFERCVGLYASLIQVNAYHQPGVEAGKKAASRVMELQRNILSTLRSGSWLGVDDLADRIDAKAERETIFKVCEHLAANNRIGKRSGATPFGAQYGPL